MGILYAMEQPGTSSIWLVDDLDKWLGFFGGTTLLVHSSNDWVTPRSRVPLRARAASPCCYPSYLADASIIGAFIKSSGVRSASSGARPQGDAATRD